MWRYVAGAVAALLMVAAGMAIFSGRARHDPVLTPTQPVAEGQEEQTAATLPATVPEATARTREQRRFGRYDKDKDGRITREEYLVARRKAFAKADRNGDGRLSFEEWAVKTTDRFAAADKDRSGSMDAAEFVTTAPKRSTRARCACPTPAASED